MDGARLVVVVAVGLILSVTLLSGPMVGAIDFTVADEPRNAVPGTGSATITVDAWPTDGVTLEKGRYGAGAYYLTVPDATVRVQSVEGSPILAYRVSVPSLGLASESLYFLSEDDRGTMTVTIDPRSLEPDRLEQDTYRVELMIELRSEDTARTLAARTVTAPVMDR